jgi:hypothetical protein
MLRIMCVFCVLLSAINANPIWIELINEFQVAPYDSERVELRYLQSAALDTLFGTSFDLYNTEVSTPPGVAYVDTNIFLTGIGQAVIDRSLLTGDFGLADDTGFVAVLIVEEIGDYMSYPGHANMGTYAPVPPINWSAAKFHCYANIWNEYCLISDWYIDSTPTFGAPNDDYPGCILSGTVYDASNQPLHNVQVTAGVVDEATSTFPPLPYYTCCTTFTAIDGSYSFDSLLPYFYDVSVDANGYVPDTQCWVGLLCCTAPMANVNFYLQTGIAENRDYDTNMGVFVRPNPFNGALYITMREPTHHIEMYDVTGKLMRRVDNRSLSTDVTIDCADLPRGIYFIAVKDQRLKAIKF